MPVLLLTRCCILIKMEKKQIVHRLIVEWIHFIFIFIVMDLLLPSFYPYYINGWVLFWGKNILHCALHSEQLCLSLRFSSKWFFSLFWLPSKSINFQKQLLKTTIQILNGLDFHIQRWCIIHSYLYRHIESTDTIIKHNFCSFFNSAFSFKLTDWAWFQLSSNNNIVHIMKMDWLVFRYADWWQWMVFHWISSFQNNWAKTKAIIWMRKTLWLNWFYVWVSILQRWRIMAICNKIKL